MREGARKKIPEKFAEGEIRKAEGSLFLPRRTQSSDTEGTESQGRQRFEVRRQSSDVPLCELGSRPPWTLRRRLKRLPTEYAENTEGGGHHEKHEAHESVG